MAIKRSWHTFRRASPSFFTFLFSSLDSAPLSFFESAKSIVNSSRIEEEKGRERRENEWGEDENRKIGRGMDMASWNRKWYFEMWCTVDGYNGIRVDIRVISLYRVFCGNEFFCENILKYRKTCERVN